MLGMVIQNQYEIQKSLGEDLLSSIYKGWDKKFERNVTVKILNKTLGEDLDFIFDRTQFLYTLNHKNIVKFYDSGVEHKYYYLIMEYVDGFTLKYFLENHKPKDPVIYSIQFCFQVASALQYGHKKYFYHGNLRPENIIIANNGNIKLDNFGIINGENYSLYNSLREIVASHYIAPEQIKGEDFDFRSDIYSLGIILYELLSGQSIKNFQYEESVGPDGKEEEFPPLKKYDDTIPKFLEAMVMKMLRRNRDERYQSINEIFKDLCKVKYKSDKIVIQELFPDIDFSPFLIIPDQEINEAPQVVISQQKVQNPDKIDLKNADLTAKRVKLDFTVLDVMCQGTGIRYKEARDALIQSGGDSLKAIDIIARRRKGLEPEQPEEENILVEEEPSTFNNEVSGAFSRLINGILVFYKNSGTEIVHIPGALLFSLLLIPLFFIYSPIVTAIIAGLIIIAYVSLDIRFELMEKDTYEFKNRIRQTLNILSSDPVHTDMAEMETGMPIFNIAPELSIQEEVKEVKRERRPRTRDKEKVEEAPSTEPVEVPETQQEDTKSSARERAAQRRREREVKKEEPPPPPPPPEEKVDDNQEKIEYICSRIEGLSPEEAGEALLEVDGDQSKAVMNLRRKRKKDRKVTVEEGPAPEPVREAPPVREEAPPPPEEPSPQEVVPPGPSVSSDFPQEKIDYVCRRTKVTPDEAIKALEENNGDEIEAVMGIKKKKRRMRK